MNDELSQARLQRRMDPKFIVPRLAAYNRLHGTVGGTVGLTADHLGELLGYKSYEDLAFNQTEDDNRVLEALAGPHGYTIYKMLLIKRGMA